MSRPARALVDAQALRHNFQQVKKHASDARVMVVVKANAYGHGLNWVASTLNQADAFAVASVEEGIQLREAGLPQPVCLLTGFFEASELLLIEGFRLSPVIHQQVQLEQLQNYSARKPFDVWLKIDTGMHRIGFRPDELDSVFRQLKTVAAVRDVRVMTHFPNADDAASGISQQQIDLFGRVTADLNAELSIANSAGIIAWPGSNMHWVRPGLMLYGASPLIDVSASKLDLKPVMTLESRLIAVHAAKKGDAVGYGGDWVCPQDMPVGVVAVGYGDGYPRHASEGTPVVVGQQSVPLIGRVSMDMITVDLRNAPAAKIGDRVVLWGDGLPVEQVAASSSTLPYELFCHVTERVPRVAAVVDGK